MSQQMQEDVSPLVAKSNRLIETSYKLTMVEQQLVLFAICQARDQQVGLSKGLPVSIDAQAFATQFGLNPERVYVQMKEAVGMLWNRHIEIHDTHLKSGKPRVIKTRWVSEISYVDGAGIVEFVFADRVVPYITRLEKEFTTYRLTCIAQMKSIYAVRIYELLVQFIGIGSRKFELVELKEILGIANEYNVINDLKKRVLDKAVQEINAHSDLTISYSQTKTGRAVTGIIFSIRRKAATTAVAKKTRRPVQLPLTGVDLEPKKPRTPESDALRDDTLRAVAKLKSRAAG